MGIKSALQKALKKLPFGSTPEGTFPFGTNFSLWNRAWANNKIDFTAEVGDLRDSSIVMAGVTWVGRSLATGRPMVVETGADMKETEVLKHPVTDLLRHPNDYYSFATLCRGIAYSWLTFATAYVIKSQNNLGETSELWYEPHWSIRPRWDDKGAEFITNYEVLRNGIWYPIKKESVIVLRDGIDMDTRCGLSATSSLIRDYYTEKQAAMFTAQLLKNGLVPPIMVSLGDKDYPFTGDTEAVKDAIMRKISGDGAGEPLVFAGNVKAEKLGFDYSSFGFRDLRQVPQMAFCSAMGISPTSLYFDTSRKESTYANVEQFLKHDYRSYIVPLQSYFADELTASLLPEFDESEDRRVTWDYSQVAIMQADQTIITANAVSLFEKDVLKRSEAREMLGYKWEPDDEIYSSDVAIKKAAAAPKPDPLPQNDMPNDAAPTKAAPIANSVLDDSAEYWLKNPALTADERELMDAKPYVNGKVS